jgi:PAS domain S-box-containing protein
MRDEQIPHHFQAIRQQMEALQRENSATLQEMDATLEDLQVIYEQMQTSLEAAEVVEAELFQQKQHYQNLFQFSPIAYLLTDADGVILEANQAIAHLLNVPPISLAGKPLAVFVAERDRAAFRTRLHWLSQSTGTQVWQMSLCPRSGEPVGVELHVGIARNPAGLIENLRIVVYNLSQPQPEVAHSTKQQTFRGSRAEGKIPMPQLPQSLDGLRVLVVDDEADIREFISALLEAHGIGVRAVDSAVAALDELERFRPDVLLSDIRMPGGDGYRLIQQIRALEAQQGGHLPAAAMTAYLDEDQEKSLQAGFEGHLYKLAQPNEWVETIAKLAGRVSV